MGVFSSTDKNKDNPNWLNLDELSLVDVSRELNTSLNMEPRLFNRFRKEEVQELLLESGLLKAVQSRGFPNCVLSLEILNDYDNRVYIKTGKDKILVHMRLKVSQFHMKGDDEQFPMIYIDWLLTQNLNFTDDKIKKELYFGQEYPGLNVLNEITDFIRLLSKKLGTSGAFNVPEYFHDAVLFSRKFRFIDPEKEGTFRALIHSFKGINLRLLSSQIHQNKVCFVSGEPYEWKYGEMISCTDIYLEKKVFQDSYFKKVEEIKQKLRFVLKSANESI
ncbi:hypothetical protein LPTSP3_g27930 [Leptospira kobayashii]|uniref:Uncharacterized protein n=1 Tax=Leptospira kobayashii TaxID=1917830 RepID=A0ABN6KK68_9LEPT|nr:hypothetical protein [Leptospira kobayashii]BDA79863.1 hypothetical protein LPTSP3_g27930 [Leptospira kobayashii]